MNLTSKVLLSLALVISVALLVIGLLVGRSADTAYRSYLSRMQQRQLDWAAQQVAAVYAETGSWQQAQAWLDESDASMVMPGRVGPGRQQGRGPLRPGSDSIQSYWLVDPETGTLRIDPARQMEPSALAAGSPVLVDGVEVARLVPAFPTSSIGSEEQALIDRINRAILLSALVAGAVALLVGGLLLASILRPLRRLEAGVAQVAQGDLQARVPVNGRDEIGRLATGFNQMAVNLQHQEELRQHMVADIAHELRTPLSVIQGNLQAIIDGVYPLEKREVETIYEETRLLSRLISDLHELAQAEAGQLLLTRQPISVSDVLAHMVDSFQPLATEKKITLVSVPPDPNPEIVVDPDRLQQILHNLLGNALRHTAPGGTIHLTAQLLTDDELAGERFQQHHNDYTKEDRTKYVRFRVQDSGEGIQADALPHVFDRFYRVDSSRNHTSGWHQVNDGGTGLGLAIAKALVELHGGHISVESQLGKGTTFWFDLPAAAAPTR